MACGGCVMLGCPDCCLFFTGPSKNWLLLEHRSIAHHGSGVPEPPGLIDPGGADLLPDHEDWALDVAGVLDQ